MSNPVLPASTVLAGDIWWLTMKINQYDQFRSTTKKFCIGVKSASAGSAGAAIIQVTAPDVTPIIKFMQPLLAANTVIEFASVSSTSTGNDSQLIGGGPWGAVAVDDEGTSIETVNMAVDSLVWRGQAGAGVHNYLFMPFARDSWIVGAKQNIDDLVTNFTGAYDVPDSNTGQTSAEAYQAFLQVLMTNTLVVSKVGKKEHNFRVSPYTYFQYRYTRGRHLAPLFLQGAQRHS